MKLFNFYFLGLALMSVMFTSCGDDDPVVLDRTFDDGVLIINEGPFSGGSASLDFYDRSADSIVSNVYSAVNDEQVIGSILQSVTIIGDNAYLVVNNSAKIEVVDANTLQYKNTITGVFSPRYMVDLGNGNAAVSEWGLDGISGQIKLVDLSTMTVQDSIPLSGPEQMVVANGKLYVANSGGFGESNKVSVHGLDLAQQIAIPVGKRTIDMVQDANGDLWVLSGGSYVTNDGASLCRIKNDIKQNCIDLEGFPSDLIINDQGTRVFYVENGLVNSVNVATPTESAIVNTPNVSGTIYGLGYDGAQEALLIGTTPDFSSASTTHIIFDNGDTPKTFTTGVLTNGFIVR